MLAAQHARAAAAAARPTLAGAAAAAASAPVLRRSRPAGRTDRHRAAALSVPAEALAAGAVVIAGTLAVVSAAIKAQQEGKGMDGGGPAAGAAVAGAAKRQAAARPPPPPPPPPRQNAVLVLGSTGRLGRRVVERLLASGRTVVAAARSEARARDVLLGPADKGGGLALVPGTRLPSGGALFLETAVDVTNPASLSPSIFAGVSQVVLALGGVVGRLPDGGFGYVDDMSPERVEAIGVANVVAAIAAAGGLPDAGAAGGGSPAALVVPMGTAADLARWDRLDDVIMGGASSSALLSAAADDAVAAPQPPGVAAWRGDLVYEGGGFCGQRTQKLGVSAGADWSAFDGVELRVRVAEVGGRPTSDSPSTHLQLLPNGKVTFKLNVKTLDQEDVPEATYQASFDADAEGGWATARLPWSDFVRVERAQAVAGADDGAAALDPSQISKVGFVYSRFAYNKARNPNHLPGAFELQIQGGIRAYTAPRPLLVAVGSAGVERNALVGDDAERRRKEIPIVQLNPGGVLNHKLAAEAAVRESGLPYCVVRCTGLVEEAGFAPPPPPAPAAARGGEAAAAAASAAPAAAAARAPAAAAPAPDAPVPWLEADQGDSLVGRLTRDDAAAAVVAALSGPGSVAKTFELRRADPPPKFRGAPRRMAGARDWLRLFSRLERDEERARAGLDPIPRPVPPPPPPSDEAKAAVLADPEVQRAAARDRAVRAAEVGRREQAEQAERAADAEAPVEAEALPARR